jgi:hypothetical protein
MGIDPFHIYCPTCVAEAGQACRRRLLRRPRASYHRERLRSAATARACPQCRELTQGFHFPSDHPRSICGYCTNWGVF